MYALTTHQLQVERRESHRDNQVYALTTHQLQVERRERDNQVYTLTTHQLQVERRESHRANQVYALTTHQLQVERRPSDEANQCMLSPHTSYRWRGERVIETIKCMHSPHTSYRWRGDREMKPISVWGWLGGHDGQRPVGEFGQDTGVTPLLFFEGHHGIFNDHRESGARFNVSSEGRCFRQYSALITILGC